MGIGSPFGPCVVRYGHVWRWVIVPLDFVWSFDMISAHYCSHVCDSPRDNHYMLVWFKFNSHFLGMHGYKKSGSLPHMMARWLPQWIPYLNFLGHNWHRAHKNRVYCTDPGLCVRKIARATTFSAEIFPEQRVCRIVKWLIYTGHWA